MSQLTTTQRNALNALSPRLTSAGLNFGDVIENVLEAIATGSFGIEADAGDVDSLAKGGGAFGIDADNTTGLTLAYFAGRVRFGKTVVSVAAGTVLLSASQVNYVEVDSAGTVAANIVGFTSGKVPLYQITAGAATIDLTLIVSKKALLSGQATGAVTGELLTTAGATKTVESSLVTLSATGSVAVIAPVTGTLAGVRLRVSTTLAASDTNYWTFDVQEKGAAGTGTTAMLAATDPNTTLATGGSGLTANVARVATLHGTGANLIVTKGDVIILTGTKTAAAADLVNLLVSFDFIHTN